MEKTVFSEEASYEQEGENFKREIEHILSHYSLIFRSSDREIKDP